MKKYTPGELLKITWIDANSPDTRSWTTVDSFRDTNPVMEIESVGFFIEKKNGFIRIAACKSGGDEYEETINRTFNVPIGCIKKIRRTK
jgi:hypothetical protein